MGELTTSSKKAQEAPESVMSEYHQAKQKGISRWKKYLRSNNPDCYLLDGCIVVLLDKGVTEANVEDVTSVGDIIEDKSGKYYGVIPTR